MGDQPKAHDYEYITCTFAGETLIADAINEVKYVYQQAPKKSSNRGSLDLGPGGTKCKELFHCGLELSTNEFIRRRCGDYSSAHKVMKVVLMQQNETELSYYLARGSVLVFRPIAHMVGEERWAIQDLGPASGMFMILKRPGYPGLLADAWDTIILKPNQAIIIDGHAPIKYPTNGGGLMIVEVITPQNRCVRTNVK